MKVRGKLLIYILTSTFFLFLVAIGFLSYNLKEMSTANAKMLVQKEAAIHAFSFKASFDSDLTMLRTLATCFKSYQSFPSYQKSMILNEMQKDILISNPQVLTVGTSWENRKFDSLYLSQNGRFLEGFLREKGKIKSIKRNFLEDTTALYHKLKESKGELFTPYRENYSGRPNDSVLVASLATPVIVDGEFHGLAGIDVALSRFEKLIATVSPLPESYAFLLSNSSQFIAHPDSSYTFRPLNTFIKDPELYRNVANKVRGGEMITFDIETVIDSVLTDAFVVVAPIHLSQINKPWAIGIVVPYDEVLHEARFNLLISFIIGFFSLLLLTIFTSFFAKRIIDPLKDTSEIVQELATGEIDTIRPLLVETQDEIGQIRQSVNILLEALKRTASFAQEIGQGVFDAKYEKLSENDVLGNALLDMQASLKLAEDEDNKRSVEELKMTKTTEGLALFGDILRDNLVSVNELAYSIISNLVKHLNAVQGGFYFIDPTKGEDEKITLLAFYAFGEKQAMNKEFSQGEGIIGEVVRKNEEVKLIDVPNSYIEVESGLGRSNPRHFLAVPISNENGVYGALEVSSFKEMEEQQIDFVGKLSHSIARTLETILANKRTHLLLKETDEQKAQLEQTEQNLKKNLQMMEEVQRSTKQREAELESVLSALHTIFPIAEYDMKGTIISANDVLLKLLGMNSEDLIGRKQGSLQSNNDSIHFEEFWAKLRNGGTVEDIQHIVVGEREVWLNESYTPILDETGKPYKVLNITTDITARILLEKKLEEKENEV